LLKSKEPFSFPRGRFKKKVQAASLIIGDELKSMLAFEIASMISVTSGE